MKSTRIHPTPLYSQWLVLGLVALILVVATPLDSAFAQGATQKLDATTFPYFGPDIAQYNYIHSGVAQGWVFFNTLAGKIDGEKALHFLAMMFALIGATLIFVVPSFRDITTIACWFALVIIILLLPAFNNSPFFTTIPKDLGVENPYLAKPNAGGYTFSSEDSARDNQTQEYRLFFPQAVVLHATSLLHRVILQSLYMLDKDGNISTRDFSSGMAALSALQATPAAQLGERSLIQAGLDYTGPLACGGVEDFLKEPTAASSAASKFTSLNNSPSTLPRQRQLDLYNQTFTFGNYLNAFSQYYATAESSRAGVPLLAIYIDKQWATTDPFLKDKLKADAPLTTSWQLGMTSLKKEVLGNENATDTELASFFKIDGQDRGADLGLSEYGLGGRSLEEMSSAVKYIIGPSSIALPRENFSVMSRAVDFSAASTELVNYRLARAYPGPFSAEQNKIVSEVSSSGKLIREMPVAVFMPMWLEGTLNKLGESKNSGIRNILASNCYTLQNQLRRMMAISILANLGVDPSSRQAMVDAEAWQTFAKKDNLSLTTPEHEKKLAGAGFRQYSSNVRKVETLYANTLQQVMAKRCALAGCASNSKPTNDDVEEARRATINTLLQIGIDKAPSMKMQDKTVQRLADKIYDSDFLAIGTVGEQVGGFASYISEIGVWLKSIFAGAAVETYVKFLRLLINMSITLILMSTPLLFTIGLLWPPYAMACLVIPILMLLVVKLVPVTFALVQFIIHMSAQVFIANGGGMSGNEAALLTFAAATMYTSMVGITMYLVFRLGDISGAISSLTQIDSVSKDIADQSVDAAQTIALGAAGAAAIGAMAIGGGMSLTAAAAKVASVRNGAGNDALAELGRGPINSAEELEKLKNGNADDKKAYDAYMTATDKKGFTHIPDNADRWKKSLASGIRQSSQALGGTMSSFLPGGGRGLQEVMNAGYEGAAETMTRLELDQDGKDNGAWFSKYGRAQYNKNLMAALNNEAGVVGGNAAFLAGRGDATGKGGTGFNARYELARDNAAHEELETFGRAIGNANTASDPNYARNTILKSAADTMVSNAQSRGQRDAVAGQNFDQMAESALVASTLDARNQISQQLVRGESITRLGADKLADAALQSARMDTEVQLQQQLAKGAAIGNVDVRQIGQANFNISNLETQMQIQQQLGKGDVAGRALSSARLKDIVEGSNVNSAYDYQTQLTQQAGRGKFIKTIMENEAERVRAVSAVLNTAEHEAKIQFEQMIGKGQGVLGLDRMTPPVKDKLFQMARMTAKAQMLAEGKKIEQIDLGTMKQSILKEAVDAGNKIMANARANVAIENAKVQQQMIDRMGKSTIKGVVADVWKETKLGDFITDPNYRFDGKDVSTDGVLSDMITQVRKGIIKQQQEAGHVISEFEAAAQASELLMKMGKDIKAGGIKLNAGERVIDTADAVTKDGKVYFSYNINPEAGKQSANIQEVINLLAKSEDNAFEEVRIMEKVYDPKLKRQVSKVDDKKKQPMRLSNAQVGVWKPTAEGGSQDDGGDDTAPPPQNGGGPSGNGGGSGGNNSGNNSGDTGWGGGDGGDYYSGGSGQRANYGSHQSRMRSGGYTSDRGGSANTGTSAGMDSSSLQQLAKMMSVAVSTGIAQGIAAQSMSNARSGNAGASDTFKQTMNEQETILLRQAIEKLTERLDSQGLKERPGYLLSAKQPPLKKT